MKALVITRPGSFDVLQVQQRPVPVPGPDELLVKVAAVGVNRADCLQREGLYPTPAGVAWADVPGLELAGEVAGKGEAVTGFEIGDRVFGLVPGNAYAEYALVDSAMAVATPPDLSDVEAASLIEALATANETVFELGGLRAGETVLVHAAASSVGITAVQMAKSVGARVFVTAGSRHKLDRLAALGADLCIDYKQQDFVAAVREAAPEGVDLIIDFIGADYVARNLDALRKTGRLMLVGLLGSPTCVFDPGTMIAKRLTMRGFTLRAQTVADKRLIVQRAAARWLPRLAAGEIRPVIHATVPLERAGEAHRMMEDNANTGKIVLTVS